MFKSRHPGAFTDSSGAAYSSSAAAYSMVLEKKVSVTIEHREALPRSRLMTLVARRIGQHLSRRLKRNLASLQYGEEQIGWEKSKSGQFANGIILLEQIAQGTSI